MSTPVQEPTPGTRSPRWRRFVRTGFPLAVVAVAAAVVAALMLWPGNETQEQYRAMGAFAAVLLTVALLSLWLIFFSGLSRRGTALGVIAAVALFFLTVRIHFDGNMWALPRFRPWVLALFNARPEDQLAAERREQEHLPKRAVDLTHEGPNDFPAFRGRNRDGVVQGPPLERDWEGHPPRLVWGPQRIGGGYAGFAVVNGFAVTIEQRGPKEVVVCYDARNGRELWAYGWEALFDETLGGPGPRATPTIDGGEVFALGATGRLVCLDGKDGSPKWEVETLAENRNVPWGMSGSPLVVGSLVVVNPGAQVPEAAGRALVAYDRRSGKEVWRSGRTRAGYSSPVLATLGGKPQILLFDGEGLGGYDPADGRELWRFPWVTQEGINVAQPVVLPANEVLIASGYNVGAALLRISESEGKWRASQVWHTKPNVMRAKFASPVAYNGYLYGLNDGILECLDLKTGRVKWKDDRRAGKGEAYAHGQLLLTNGLIVVLTQFGELVLVEATPDEFRELGRFQALTKGKKTWNNFALVDGKAYVRNDEQMACYDLTGK